MKGFIRLDSEHSDIEKHQRHPVRPDFGTCDSAATDLAFMTYAL